MPFTLHAAWLRSDAAYPDGFLFFWAENTETGAISGATGGSATGPSSGQPAASSGDSPAAPVATNGSATVERNGRPRSAKIPLHPFQASVGQVRAVVTGLAPGIAADDLQLTSATIWLPGLDGVPLARRSVLHRTLQEADRAQAAIENGAEQVTSAGDPGHGDDPTARVLTQCQVTGVQLPPLAALVFLAHLDHQSTGRTVRQPGSWQRVRLGNDLLFWSNAAKLTMEVLVGQHYLPSVRADASGRFFSSWQTSLLDQRIDRQVSRLVKTMPPVCRAYNLPAPDDVPAPAALVEHFLSTLVDVAVRTWGESALPSRADSSADLWLYSLLTDQRQLYLGPQAAHDFYREWRTWTEQLHVPADANFRICFALYEPDTDLATGLPGAAEWRLRYYLQARDNPALLISAREVWETQEGALRFNGRRLDRPQERLLAGLGIASRFFAPIERSLRSTQPEEALLTSDQAHVFLREIGPLLESSGFGLLLPDWWHGTKRARLGLRMRLLADDEVDDELDDGLDDGFSEGEHGPARIRYRWDLMLGDNPLTADEFAELTALNTPLIKLHGRWVELDPGQVEAAQSFLQQRQVGGHMGFLQALRMAQEYAGPVADGDGDGGEALDEIAAASFAPLADLPAQLPLDSVDVEGWLERTLFHLRSQELPRELAEPEGFVGSLRPYQQRGVGWLAYLRSLNVGACLADDMGLGKTIQAIALLLHVRQQAAASGASRIPAALLICPTSVVANWKHEMDRFAPQLSALVHHGINRLTGDEFRAAVDDYDLVITSYGTARRDIDLLSEVVWSELILDEAQNIKNPRAKQTQAVRRLSARNRLALTGTPVENHLAELWSIMEYLNPGYLGGFERFRKQFIVPIERYNDEERADELRRIVQPFLLRRLKSDPTIISDLPEKNEMVVYCSLTNEQVSLYEKTVREALNTLDNSRGIQRRGLVLALVTKLKQISNHPSHYLRDEGPLAGRSGKFDRVTEMLEEALSAGDRALVFTQFVEMGHLLQRHLSTVLETEVLFLHGGISAKQRDRMVQYFQSDEGPPVFVLSLRAGGSGLNLTRANHVFHFDRWWNPAVEDQATDRAFRIGQTRNVQVHKFVVANTLEERIHQMIESKQALAESIVGSGEDWLTELDNDQLRDLLILRRETPA